MDQNPTMLEIHSALNQNNISQVAEAMKSFRPAILGQMLRAVDEAYRRRVNHPHADYGDAVKELSKKQEASRLRT